MAIPSRATFDQYSLHRRLGMVMGHGTYLLQRVDNAHVINLYYLGSFFVEVYYDPEVNHLYDCRTFVGKEELEQYAVCIDLPAL
ncbi:hypothetical protein [Hymenobacter profundi]|uniref:Uncharacterized protein n=1 Tax=Hymenobacter profundi TaxID=1982110 RepID=A0ABS6WZ29_9BACT|nr:hypothetical protein [Hymenobacter profundi]MBW3128847.1 hypothetical protein [Hymenobacter profundi]